VDMEISKKAWKDVASLKQIGVQVRKCETNVVEEFNKVQYYGGCRHRRGREIKNFHVGGLKVDERFLAMIVTKIVVPHRSNYSTVNEGDLVLMYFIHYNIHVDWTFALHDHIMKVKRLMDFKLSYMVLISKFIEYFGVDVDDKLEEPTSTLNHVSCFNLHKMGFSKVNNVWNERNEGGGARNNNDEVRPSGVNQGDGHSKCYRTNGLGSLQPTRG